MTLTVTVTAAVTLDGRGPQRTWTMTRTAGPFCVTAAVTVTAYVTDVRARGRLPCQ